MQVWTAALTLVLVLSMIFFLYSVFGKKSSFSDVEDEYNHIKSYPRPVFHLLGDSITENRYNTRNIIMIVLILIYVVLEVI